MNSGNRIHKPVIVGTRENAIKVVPWVHTVINNFNCAIRGVHYGVSSKRLSRYFSEFCYRVNQRFWEPQMFDRILTVCLNSSTIMYAKIRV